jgi:hypothetical protein
MKQRRYPARGGIYAKHFEIEIRHDRNDEARMTNVESMTNSQVRSKCLKRILFLDIRRSAFLRAWSFFVTLRPVTC